MPACAMRSDVAPPQTKASRASSRDLIRSSVGRHATAPGSTTTLFEGVELFRVEAPFERTPGIYAPCVCAIVAGEKIVRIEDAVHVFGEDRYVCATLPTPVLADVPNATPSSPLLGVIIRLHTHTVSRLVLEAQVAHGTLPTSDGPRPGLDTAARDSRFDVALAGLLELLDDPPAAAVLGEGRLREVLYAILLGEAGERVRTDFGRVPALATTLAHLHTHIAEDFSVDALARRAGMSRAAFDRQFKATTLLSPLQYIKALRLHEASMRLAQGEGVGEAATAVGYHNASQFSREFRRKFGASPRQWAQRARDIAPAGVDPLHRAP